VTEPTPGSATGLVIADEPDRQRYEATRGGDLAGVLEYVVKRERIALVHTQVSQGHEGQGVGAGLARFALDDARRRGLRVIAICPYVRRYLARHPEDDDIVVGPAGYEVAED
jgi:predicted GNAT family acetyltransferase